MRSSPNPSAGHGDSEAIHSIAARHTLSARSGLSARVTESRELSPIALELLALRRRRPAPGAWPTKRSFARHPLRTGDLLLAAARARRRRPRSCAPARVARPRRRSSARRPSRARPERRYGGTSAPPPAPGRARARSLANRRQARARVTRSGAPRLGQLRPDLLRHVRQHGVQAAPAAARAPPAQVAIASGVTVVETRLDRLGVPVAEIVEGEVVEHVDRVRRSRSGQ